MGLPLLLCNSSVALSSPPPPAQPLPPRAAAATPVLCAPSAGRKLVSAALSGALSFSLLFSPPSIASESPLARTTKSEPSVEYCREEEKEDAAGAGPERVTNERIVEEAWSIVNESFLNTSRRLWSPEAWQAHILSLSLSLWMLIFNGALLFLLPPNLMLWAEPFCLLHLQRKKEDILSTSIPTRSKAHELIRRMLAGLGDPYTRFLSPDEVISSLFALVNFVENLCLWLWQLMLGWRNLTLLVSLHFFCLWPSKIISIACTSVTNIDELALNSFFKANVLALHLHF